LSHAVKLLDSGIETIKDWNYVSPMRTLTLFLTILGVAAFGTVARADDQDHQEHHDSDHHDQDSDHHEEHHHQKHHKKQHHDDDHEHDHEHAAPN
jgi:hypothetical protein